MRRQKPDVAWADRLVVEPDFVCHDDEPTTAASLDFHLGNRFTVFRRRRNVIHNPLASEMQSTVAGSVASRNAEISTQEFFVPFGEHFVVHPGHVVLGTTLEWFRIPLNLMAYVVGRSIWGRRGLLVATATAVQPGSVGTITLELSNTGEIALSLFPGVRIGQLFFHQVEPPEDKFAARTRFAGAVRPILGTYKSSASERFLLGQDAASQVRHETV